MSQPEGAASPSASTSSSHPHPAPTAAPPLARRSTVFQAAGALGIAGFSIGLVIFLVACFGFDAVLFLSPLPVLMGLVGFVLTIIGGVTHPQIDGSQVAASLFINVAAIVGGLLEIAAWQGWRIFA